MHFFYLEDSTGEEWLRGGKAPLGGFILERTK